MVRSLYGSPFWIVLNCELCEIAVNGDGVITCEEFTKVFINMGFEEREKELKAYRKMQQDQEVLRKQREQEAKAEQDSYNAQKVAYNFNDDDWETAMFKLKEAAWR